ncbi:MAG: M48 family metallopeptidase [Planctomycetota bacterium]|nr:M48 family metallopeptidase [Planctomycetota bacterium]
MYGYILVSLVLAIVGPYLAPGPPLGASTTLLGVAAVTAVVFVAGLGISFYIRWRSAPVAIDEQRFLRKVGLLAKLYRLLVVAAYGFILGGVRWAPLAADWAGRDAWGVVPLAITLAPLVVLQTAAWIAVFSADRRLRALLFQRAGAAAAVHPWTLPRYLEFMFRQYLLIILVPLLVLVAADDAIGRLLGSPEMHPLSAAVLVGFLAVALALAGPWFRLCWRTAPLPEGGLRDRLQSLADRAGVRIGNILVWRTNVTIANGCMVGMVAPLRYILVTDALLMSLAPEEIEAVFAHEVAHVKFRHVALYMVMALGGASAGVLAGTGAAMLDASAWTANLAVGAAVLAYWGLGFGFVSRRCELECDLYAVRATACPVDCSPPDAGARTGRRGAAEPRPAGPGAEALPRGICEHRVTAMAAALRRIARLNGSAETARGWRHFSIARRCRFLGDALADPLLASRLERRLRRIKMAVVLGVFVLMAAAGVAISTGEGPLEADNPENPTGPEDVAPRVHRWLVRLVDGDQVDAVAFGAPQLRGDADAVADLDDGGHAGLGGRLAVRDDDVAVHKPRGHAVAVDAQGEGPRQRRAGAREFEILDDSVGRRRG